MNHCASQGDDITDDLQTGVLVTGIGTLVPQENHKTNNGRGSGQLMTTVTFAE